MFLQCDRQKKYFDLPTNFLSIPAGEEKINWLILLTKSIAIQFFEILESETQLLQHWEFPLFFGKETTRKKEKKRIFSRYIKKLKVKPFCSNLHRKENFKIFSEKAL